MFAWFERRIDPYPGDSPAMPPRSLWRFLLHYSHGALPWLTLLAAFSGVIALIEVMLFGWLGDLVDRMADTPRALFWTQQGGRLALMALVLLILLPGLNLIASLVLHQSLMGNFPQRIRWQAHRYLLRQSIGYFQDEFAGRIAQRLMQTALAVREVAMKIMDVGSYVLIYFLGALALAGSQDWRLAVPFALWAVAYAVMLWQIVPRLGRVAQEQADARSAMTGRVVDSYTNIATVKLFSHSAREEDWMRDGMDAFLRTVHRQMRLSTIQDVTLNAINVALIGAVTALGLWLWSEGRVEVG
nr:ABC transporter ATP-binding protein/permease [Paracoccus sp. (in: a-proteobacteria)]